MVPLCVFMSIINYTVSKSKYIYIYIYITVREKCDRFNYVYKKPRRAALRLGWATAPGQNYCYVGMNLKATTNFLTGKPGPKKIIEYSCTLFSLNSTYSSDTNKLIFITKITYIHLIYS